MLTTFGRRVLGIALIAAAFAVIGMAMCATADSQADQYQASDAGSSKHSSIMGD